MDFFSEETFIKVEDKPASIISAALKKQDECTSKTLANKRTEDEPIPSTSIFMGINDGFTSSAFIKEKDEPISSISTKVSAEDESTSSTLPFKNIEDEFASSTSAFMNQGNELISSTSANMRIEELSSSASTKRRAECRSTSSASPNMKAEVESTSPSTTISFNAVQRDRKIKKGRNELSFKPYILKVKKAKIPNLKLSSEALKDLNNLISDVYKMYCSELKRMVRHTKKRTLSTKEIETATKLCIPGKRKDNAMSYGRDCVSFQELDLKQKPMQ